MKLVIASDIHGSAYWCRKLLETVESEAPSKLVLLGDLLYHGPRNALPQDYDPASVAAMLNGLKERIVAVRGNCDSEVDQMVLEFPCLADYAMLIDGDGRTLYCTHGHLHCPDSMPPLPAGSLFLSGHTHVKVLEERNGITVANPGSVSIPKDGSNSCAVYEDGALRFVELN